MKSKPEVIAVLNEGLCAELTAINYLAQQMGAAG